MLESLRHIFGPIEPEHEALLEQAAFCELRRLRALRFEVDGIRENRCALQTAALQEWTQELADLDRRIAGAEQGGRHAEAAGLRAKRNSAEQTAEQRLEDAALLGSIPAHDRTVALIRFEGPVNRDWWRLMRCLQRSKRAQIRPRSTESLKRNFCASSELRKKNQLNPASAAPARHGS